MSAAVASSSRRNSSSVTHIPAPSPPFLLGDRRRMSATTAAATPPGAPVRMTSLAQAAALATAEAERRAAARAASTVSSPQSVKSMSTSRTSRQTRSNSTASMRMGAMKAAATSAKQSNSSASTTSTQKPKQRSTKQSAREVVLTTSSSPSPVATAADSSDAATVHLIINMLGLKFRCRVQRDWPCEAMIATAIAEYHLAFPACELPDFSTIYHVGRNEWLKAADPIGAVCTDDDELELGIADKQHIATNSGTAGATHSDVSAGSSDGGERTLFDFRILFHRLPLGFTLKQHDEHIVVATIYPHSTATHYERLAPGVRVEQIGGTRLADLGLRQVHDLIKTAAIPLEIHFRTFAPPSLRATLLLAAANGTAGSTGPGTESPTEPTRRASAPSPTPEDDSSSSNGASPQQRSTRERARTTSNASGRRVELVTTAPSNDRGQRPASAGSSGRRSGRNRRNSQESRDEREHQSVDDNQHHNNSSSSNGSGLQQPSRRGRASSRNAGQAATAATASSDSIEPLQLLVRDSGGDSNQHETDDEAAEARLVDEIKALQVALVKKHEEAKQIARQIEQCHDKLAAVKNAKAKNKRAARAAADADADADRSSAAVPAPPQSVPSSTLKLRLTPEVLEAMDSKAGVPPKSASYYMSSNVSSVSGYSNYSRGSNSAAAAAHRSSARASSRRADRLRADASVERRRGSSQSRSPRSQCVKNINNRYSYTPQTYSSGAVHSEASTSLSSRGAVMSRAKATRDSFITKSESPGVGYYDVRLPASHVRGGEIGDSDRSLPWP